jgi:glycosyltransferase involved in cell wall biosynthesis
MKVSVLMITYNHEKFIAQAIDSILMQQVNFEYEIVIGEDCSTDDTREIIIEYQNKHPEKIKTILNDKNLGVSRNFVQTYHACHGDYIAFLEGDDYWLDKFKLEKQILFLEENKQYSMCFTDARIIDENNIFLDKLTVPEQFRKHLSQTDIIGGYCPPTLTVVARKYSINFPRAFYTITNSDFFLFSEIASFGEVAYMSDITSCYRVHPGGIWSMKDEEYYVVNSLRTRQVLLQFFGKNHRDILVPQIYGSFVSLISYYSNNRRKKKFFIAYLNFLKFLIVYKPILLLRKVFEKILFRSIKLS